MDNKLRKALGLKFQFSVANADSNDHLLYILAGIYNTLGLAVTQSATTPFAVSAVTPNWFLITAITNAGFATGVVADDGAVGNSVTCTAGTSTLKIRQFREYIQVNPLYLRSMTISADNVEVFDEEIIFARTNPLRKRVDEEALILSEYFDTYQQQTGKINVNFGENPVLLDAKTLMYMNIPDGRTVTYILKF